MDEKLPAQMRNSLLGDIVKESGRYMQQHVTSFMEIQPLKL